MSLDLWIEEFRCGVAEEDATEDAPESCWQDGKHERPTTDASCLAIEYPQILHEDRGFGDVDRDSPDAIHGHNELGNHDGVNRCWAVVVRADSIVDSACNEAALDPCEDLISLVSEASWC